MLKNSRTMYGSVAKWFHWIIFFLVAFMLFLGYFMGDITDKALRGTVMNYHKLIGLTILVLMILRLVWALMNQKPVLPLGTPWWEHVAERSMHMLLYGVILAMPLAGWIGSVAAGYAPHFFGLRIGLPLSPSKVVDSVSFSIHNTLAIVIIVLVSLHVLAALFHAVIKKDDILQRMMPSFREK